MKATETNRRRIAAIIAALLMVAAAAGLHWLIAKGQVSTLERIREQGRLLVATRHSPEVFHAGANGPDGLAYALTQRFAEALQIEVEYVFPSTLEALIGATERGEVHLAAAGLTRTPVRAERLQFSRPYRFVTEQLVYRMGDPRPKSPAGITAGQLHVLHHSSHEETLAKVSASGYPGLSWTAHKDVNMVQLLSAVERGEIRYTVADSSDIALHRRIFPQIGTAFELGDAQPVAWAFSKVGDSSLRSSADRFLKFLEADGELERLQARYFGHAGKLNYVDVREFWRHVRDRLPALRPFFLEAEEITGIDWRLLAAVGYQESHWNKNAVSPTGVRGIMMITLDTARQMGVKNRLDPRQSIIGGARYLRVVEKKIPARISDINRLWLTLAGYNIGFGHLEDARILTQRQGADPDLWLEVKKRLPLLRQEAYHSTLKHGFARGNEPVTYVDNIRNYYDLLLWFTTTDDLAIRERLIEPEPGNS